MRKWQDDPALTPAGDCGDCCGGKGRLLLRRLQKERRASRGALQPGKIAPYSVSRLQLGLNGKPGTWSITRLCNRKYKEPLLSENLDRSRFHLGRAGKRHQPIASQWPEVVNFDLLFLSPSLLIPCSSPPSRNECVFAIVNIVLLSVTTPPEWHMTDFFRHHVTPLFFVQSHTLPSHLQRAL
jgi:hypothetical protein